MGRAQYFTKPSFKNPTLGHVSRNDVSSLRRYAGLINNLFLKFVYNLGFKLTPFILSYTIRNSRLVASTTHLVLSSLLRSRLLLTSARGRARRVQGNQVHSITVQSLGIPNSDFQPILLMEQFYSKTELGKIAIFDLDLARSLMVI